MKVLHIPDHPDGYEEVTLIANRVSRKNQLSYIEKDGQEFMTGGFIVEDTPKIREILDSMPKSEHYKFMRSIRVEPFVKSYLQE